MKNILFFSVSIGTGHDSAARSLEQQFVEKIPDVQTKIIDTFDYINPTLHKVVLGSYMETLKFNPKVWGYLYHQGEKDDRIIDMGQILNKLLSIKLHQLIEGFQPDVIICTHAFPAGILSTLKQNTGMKVPTVVVLTDFTVHPFWIHPYTDFYMIPSEQLFLESVSRGMPTEKIKVFGIPIKKEFALNFNKDKVKASLCFDQRPVVIVMGGGLGLGALQETVKALLKTDTGLQIIAIAGKNNKLYNQLQALCPIYDNLRVFGFVNNVSELMSAADLVISKPGGLTSAEVLAKGLPMVIVDPLPGQEDRNTEFLLNWGVAMKARHQEFLPPLVSQLFKNQLRIKHMKEMAAYLGRPLAAHNISDFVCREILSL